MVEPMVDYEYSPLIPRKVKWMIWFAMSMIGGWLVYGCIFVMVFVRRSKVYPQNSNFNIYAEAWKHATQRYGPW